MAEAPEVKEPVAQAPAVQADNQEAVGYFQDQSGNNSSMRLMCFVSLLTSILFGVITLWIAYNGKTDNGNGILITFGFLVGAFAPKAVQKFAEQNMPQKKAQ